ncbi:hypothetical protein [Yinghuangia sp. YIM S09857]|uniref:hypothetical protein n=1 Tax=Yinghuangia sp. YIM S09857 TaxID=3436929 RepID=UPI003F52F278
MVREEELHDLFTRALPGPGEEPDLPDFRPIAKREGRRLRRRRRVAAGVGALAVGAVVAGSVTSGTWLPHDATTQVAAGPGAPTTGTSGPPAPTSPPTLVAEPPVTRPSANPSVPTAPPENTRDNGPEVRLLTVLREQLVFGVTSIDFDPSTDDATYIVAFDDGTKLRITGTGLAVANYWTLPTVECGHPATSPGGPGGAQPGCDRRTLPQGGLTVAEQYTDPASGISASWLSIRTAQGSQRFLASSSMPEAGSPAAEPLTADQLFVLASNPDVMQALESLTYNQRW